MLKRIKGLRVLTLTFDNHFTREPALETIQNVIKFTGVDNKPIKLDREMMQSIYRSTLKKWSNLCYCGLYWFMESVPYAIEGNIPLIITGFSLEQRGLYTSFEIPDQTDRRRNYINIFNVLHQHFSMALKEHEPENADEILNNVFGRLKPYVQPDSKVDFYPIIIPMSNYINWSGSDTSDSLNVFRDDFKDTLKKEINWERGAESRIHTNCVIEPIKGHIETRKKFTDISLARERLSAHELSCMIRNGGLTREEGLHEMKLLGLDGTKPDILPELCDFLGITEDEFYQYVDQDIFSASPDQLEEIQKMQVALADVICFVFGIKKTTELTHLS
mmetsp:Transcript_22024/g.10380  ORF Transcript_22024/g.10380 Transcript_22024/m.10380 type:complete len:332 (-) Transcript_22024:3307-4302(-)